MIIPNDYGLSWEGPLSPEEAMLRGRGSWVYIISDQDGPAYIGQSANLKTRMNHHERHWPGMVIFIAAVDPAERLQIERKLISELNPRLNGVCGPEFYSRKFESMRTVRVPDGEWKAWGETAKAAGLSLSKWLRSLANRASKRRAK